jgi:pimeloyl-ACP methyl ester carboxylesterase
VPERRGHPHTRDVDGPLTYEIMAADTAAYLETEGGGQAHLIGWSDGAVVPLLVAPRRPDLVGRMVLIGQYYNSSGRVPGSDLDRWLHTEEAKAFLRQGYDPVSPDGPRAAYTLRRQTRRRPARTARLDPDDGIHRLTPPVIRRCPTRDISGMILDNTATRRDERPANLGAVRSPPSRRVQASGHGMAGMSRRAWRWCRNAGCSGLWGSSGRRRGLAGERADRPDSAPGDDQLQPLPGAQCDVDGAAYPGASGWGRCRRGRGSNGREACWPSSRSDAFSQPVVIRSRPDTSSIEADGGRAARPAG